MKRLALAFFLLITSPALAADYPARVVGITDGDTLTVLKADKTQVKIRLSGVDAPVTGQDYGSRAKQAASELAFGKDVTIHTTDTDRYGRTIAEVTLPDGKSLGHELTAQGMSWWYVKYAPADRELERLEKDARAARRGLWAQPNPVAPWDWRHGKGVPVTAEVIGNRNRPRLSCPALHQRRPDEGGEQGGIQDGGRGGREGVSEVEGLPVGEIRVRQPVGKSWARGEREWLSARKLTRPFTLRSLVGIRKQSRRRGRILFKHPKNGRNSIGIQTIDRLE